jgi:diacylglycerol O-acyltransferase / wax synthase
MEDKMEDSGPTRLTSRATAAGRPHDSSWEPLAVQDELFLLSERAHAHMHVGATLVLTGPRPAQHGARVDIHAIRRHLDVRLDALPRYRKRLAFTPLLKRPLWVDDGRFDIKYHVRHLALAAPGRDDQLKVLCEELMSRPLDRGKPLWELYVVEGLRAGRFAVVAKVHHCLVDGVGGVQLLGALFDSLPSHLSAGRSTWRPAAAPTAIELLGDEVRGPVARAVRALSNPEALVPTTESVRRIYGQATALGEVLRAGVQSVPASPFNQPLGPDRSAGWLTLDLNAVKAVKQRLGGTVNDVVLATVTGGLRRFLTKHRGVRRPGDLRSMVPVNRRVSGDNTACGNHIAGLLVSLPVSRAKPRDQYHAVCMATAEAKASQQVAGSEVLTASAAALLSVGVWLMEQLQPFNLVVTNVPGPPCPLYLGSARVDAIYPHVPLFANQGLGIALFSYADNLYWGFNADRTLVPDVAALAESTAVAFGDLCSAAGVRRTATQPAVLPVAARSAPCDATDDGAPRQRPIAERESAIRRMRHEEHRESA